MIANRKRHKMSVTKGNSSSSKLDQQAFMEKLTKHANRAANYRPTELKELKAVPSPNGGYRMETRVIRTL